MRLPSIVVITQFLFPIIYNPFTHSVGQAKYVTYGTRSLHEAENGGIVKRALERHKAVVDQEGESHGMNRAIYTLRPSPEGMEEGGYIGSNC